MREKVWKLLTRGGSDWIVGADLRGLSGWMRKWNAKRAREGIDCDWV